MQGWSALILAGGAGRRFGGGKLLAEMAGAPVIRRVAEAVAAADFAEVVVVTGADDAGIRAALVGLDARILHAPDWAEGMAATLRTGIAALAAEADRRVRFPRRYAAGAGFPLLCADRGG